MSGDGDPAMLRFNQFLNKCVVHIKASHLIVEHHMKVAYLKENN